MKHRSPRHAALLAAVALAVAACGGGEAAERADSALAEVTIGPENVVVTRLDTLENGPTVSGTLAAEREATIRAEVSGAVLQTYVEVGQRVERGTLLARIDADGITDAAASAQAAVANAESQAQIARREEERATRLLAAGAVAERDLEAARNARVGAEAQLAAAQAQLAAARKNLGNTTVRALFPGVVSRRAVNGGDIVSPGTELFTVVDPAHMRFEASVPAIAIADVRMGAPVSFTVAGYPGRTFTGRVTRISPMADPVTRQVQLLVSVADDGRGLVGGLFAQGRIGAERKTGIVAPSVAVDLRGTEPAVYRVKGGKVEKVAVAVGLRDEQNEMLEITKGVAVGDTLLTGAAQGITAGTLVRVSEPADAAIAKQ
ncbi:MAG TPA: efflux RND transporter periplasmic adaptor subunit [Gemmatimonadaceae bacterium]|jgi:RND family efflux transporter MFP subunit|nr:efflux RND transporter periplasmic adaptor subunit [Gemmatimonadaceae bacterium]